MFIGAHVRIALPEAVLEITNPTREATHRVLREDDDGYVVICPIGLLQPSHESRITPERLIVVSSDDEDPLAAQRERVADVESRRDAAHAAMEEAGAKFATVETEAAFDRAYERWNELSIEARAERAMLIRMNRARV